MMLGQLLRLALIVSALVGAVLLFIYAAVIAVIFIPIALFTLFLLRKKGVVQWRTVDMRTAQRPQSGRGPVIDHDPNDVTFNRR
ncbi:MAG: hypothetical protein AB7E79_04205 [Rhodospirillaceae bacterium]